MNKQEQMMASGMYEQIDPPLLNLFLLSDLTQKIINTIGCSDPQSFSLEDLLSQDIPSEESKEFGDTKAFQQTEILRERIIGYMKDAKKTTPAWMDILDKWFMLVRPIVVESLDSIEITNDEMLATYRYRTACIKMYGKIFTYKTVVKPCGEVYFDDSFIDGVINPELDNDSNIARLYKLFSSIAIFDTLSASR